FRRRCIRFLRIGRGGHCLQTGKETGLRNARRGGNKWERSGTVPNRANCRERRRHQTRQQSFQEPCQTSPQRCPCAWSALSRGSAVRRRARVPQGGGIISPIGGKIPQQSALR